MNQNKAYRNEELPSYAQVAQPAAESARYYEFPQTAQASEATRYEVPPTPQANTLSKVTSSLRTCIIIIAVAITLNFLLVIAFGGVLFHLQANSATKSEVSQLAAQNRLSGTGMLANNYNYITEHEDKLITTPVAKVYTCMQGNS